MATKAKTAAIKDKEKDQKATDAPEKDSADAPSPLLDLSDAAVKKMIKQAKKRGFVTFDQLNEVLPSDTTSPEQIEDIMSMLSDMGINVSEAEESDEEHHLTKGIRLVQEQLLAALKRTGIETFSPKGEPFDPHLHEAVATTPVDGAESGTVVEVYQAGYRLGDDVLRAAKVVVAA